MVETKGAGTSYTAQSGDDGSGHGDGDSFAPAPDGGHSQVVQDEVVEIVASVTGFDTALGERAARGVSVNQSLSPPRTVTTVTSSSACSHPALNAAAAAAAPAGAVGAACAGLLVLSVGCICCPVAPSLAVLLC